MATFAFTIDETSIGATRSAEARGQGPSPACLRRIAKQEQGVRAFMAEARRRTA
jgi:hypothetical protein